MKESGVADMSVKSRARKKNSKWRKKQPQICHYCKKELTIETSTIDHAIPCSKGGHPTEKTNLRICCLVCNNNKQYLTEQEYICFYSWFKKLPRIRPGGIDRWCEAREPYYGVFQGLSKTNRNATVLLACYEHFAGWSLNMGIDGCKFRTVQIPKGIFYEIAYNPATQSEYVQQLLGRWE